MRMFAMWVRLFGAVVISIALVHLAIGQSTYIGGGSVNATMESDLRFYNVLFAAYGAAFIWAANDVEARARIINALGALFFVGGVARLWAWVAVGAPNWFYVGMIPVELVIPIAHALMLRRIAGRGLVGAAQSRSTITGA
ncbi:hypothetical protein ASG12_04975 [Williamsia sp. Leaf354]|uniref:DUF4345 domain-containing protein n=1 Tax=Williamsia sp. Leaf354 TaxID=1736349 RepID=UPI0006FE6676|nr:DUF4345 domain-containing protein [Williamsia sp. Leaf354]KQS00284.1 hypothetical protein ASG12_04975 [Williamsia sp. Leaf354]